jgi:hypothetical protein
MADRLPATVKCGDSVSGFASVTSPPSNTFSWTDEIGYGRAYGNAVDDVKTNDDKCMSELEQKVNDWLEHGVKCVPSEQCNNCRLARPNYIHRHDIYWEDAPAKVGRPLKSGSLSVTRTYSVTTDRVRCLCPRTIIID